MNLPAWIWPKTTRPAEKISVRFGRLLHWVTIFFAACGLAGGLIATVVNVLNNELYNIPLAWGVGLVWGALIVLVGRGLRYLFAAE